MFTSTPAYCIAIATAAQAQSPFISCQIYDFGGKMPSAEGCEKDLIEIGAVSTLEIAGVSSIKVVIKTRIGSFFKGQDSILDSYQSHHKLVDSTLLVQVVIKKMKL